MLLHKNKNIEVIMYRKAAKMNPNKVFRNPMSELYSVSTIIIKEHLMNTVINQSESSISENCLINKCASQIASIHLVSNIVSLTVYLF